MNTGPFTLILRASSVWPHCLGNKKKKREKERERRRERERGEEREREGEREREDVTNVRMMRADVKM